MHRCDIGKRRRITVPPWLLTRGHTDRQHIFPTPMRFTHHYFLLIQSYQLYHHWQIISYNCRIPEYPKLEKGHSPPLLLLTPQLHPMNTKLAIVGVGMHTARVYYTGSHISCFPCRTMRAWLYGGGRYECMGLKVLYGNWGFSAQDLLCIRKVLMCNKFSRLNNPFLSFLPEKEMCGIGSFLKASLSVITQLSPSTWNT